MYFAGMDVAAAGVLLLANARPVDAKFVSLVQAQSIAPRAEEVGVTAAPVLFFELGAKLKVKPFRPAGIPLPAVAEIATEITQLVAAFGNAAQGAAVGIPPVAVLYTQ